MHCFKDNNLFANFVQPILCNDLLNAGLTPITLYRWKIFSNQDPLLVTKVFDLDDYYDDGMRAQDAINPPKMVLPAYTTKDVEKVLPEYMLTKFGGEYEVSLQNFYRTSSHKAKRLPDALAMMLEEVIRKRILKVSKINQLIYEITT